MSLPLRCRFRFAKSPRAALAAGRRFLSRRNFNGGGSGQSDAGCSADWAPGETGGFTATAALTTADSPATDIAGAQCFPLFRRAFLFSNAWPLRATFRNTPTAAATSTAHNIWFLLRGSHLPANPRGEFRRDSCLFLDASHVAANQLNFLISDISSSHVTCHNCRFTP